jgi:hypothetical protein
LTEQPRPRDDGWDVPGFDAESFDGRRSRYAACVFVIDEGERLASQLRKMRPYAGLVDLIVADGGSTDGSTDPDKVKDAGVNTLLVKRGPGKLSAQMRMALAFCLGRGYEGVVVIDGNDKDDPSALPDFIRSLDDGCDHVQGSRFIPGGRGVNTPTSRLLGIKLLHAPLISLASGFRYTDSTNGFRAYSRRLLLDPRVQPFRPIFSKYELHYYLAIRAARLGLDVREVPVTRAYPRGVKPPTKISKFRGNLLVLRTLFDACAGRYDPDQDATNREDSHGPSPDRPFGIRRRQHRSPTSLR